MKVMRKMMFATKIKMKPNCKGSDDLTEISEIFIEDCEEPGFYSKDIIYDYLMENPGSICVNISPYPELSPALSDHGEKYVRSKPNDLQRDNLLELPQITTYTAHPKDT